MGDQRQPISLPPSGGPEAEHPEDAAALAAQHGSWKRLQLAFSAPTALFADIARKPTVAAVLVVLSVVGTVNGALIVSRTDTSAAVRAQLRKSDPDISEAKIEKATAMAAKFKYAPIIAAPIVTPLVFCVLAGVLLLGLKLTGATMNFSRTLSTAAHAAWPSALVSSLLLIPIVLSKQVIDAKNAQHLLKSNVGAFLSADAHPALRSLAGSLDVFSAWNVALLVIGLATVGSITRRKSAALVITLWVIAVAAKAGLAAVMPR